MNQKFDILQIFFEVQHSTRTKLKLHVVELFRVLAANPVIDGHNDFPMGVRYLKRQSCADGHFSEGLQTKAWHESYVRFLEFENFKENKQNLSTC